MTDQPNVEIGCRFVGEFVDEGNVPTSEAMSHGEVVRPNFIAEYVEYGSCRETIKDFTILLKDGRVVSVRGHALKQVPPSSNNDNGCYGVVVRAADQEVLIAIFDTREVVAIFDGEMRSDRKIA